MQKLSTMETLIFLKKVPLFSSFELEDLLHLKEVTFEKTYHSNDFIIKENESGNSAYIIVDGLVEVLKNKEGEQLRLATLEKTAYFGEMAIIENEPRSASVKAVTDCLLLSIDGNQFQEMIKTNPELSFNLVKVFSRRIRKMNALTK